MKFYKYFLPVITFFLFCFGYFGLPTALADTTQTSHSDLVFSTSTAYSADGKYWGMELGTGNTGTMDATHLLTLWGTIQNTAYIGFWDLGTHEGFDQNDFGLNGGTFCVLNSAYSNQEIIPPSCNTLNFDPAHHYVLLMVGGNGGAAAIYGQNNATTTSHYILKEFDSAGTIYATSTFAVPYVTTSGFTLPNIQTTFAPTSDTISFQYPPASSSIESDFSSWRISYSAGTSTALSLGVYWDTTSTFSNSSHFDSIPYTFTTSASTTYTFLKSAALQSNTMYYAKAVNLGTNVSTTISFSTGQVNYTLNTNPPLSNPFTATSTEASSSLFFVDCSAYTIGLFSSTTLDGIGCVAKKVGFAITGFLIQPPGFISTYLQSSFDNLKQTFPFSIVSGIATQVASTTEDNSAASLNITMLDAKGNLVSSNLVATSTDFWVSHLTNSGCDSTCALYRKNLVFGFITTIIWLLIAWRAIKIIL